MAYTNSILINCIRITSRRVVVQRFGQILNKLFLIP
jgi:hypothetical protein